MTRSSTVIEPEDFIWTTRWKRIPPTQLCPDKDNVSTVYLNKFSKTMVTIRSLILLLILALRIRSSDGEFKGAGALVAAMTEATRDLPEPDLCASLIMADPRTPLATLNTIMEKAQQPRGVSVVEVPFPEDARGNTSSSEGVPEAIRYARKLRLSSWSLIVVVVAEDVAFLEWLGEVLQEGRVLVWSTRMIVLTKILYSDLARLLREPWSFSMMSTVFVNQPYEEAADDHARFKIYTNLPYSNRGGHVALLASWAPGAGLFKYSDLPFFGEKFARFYGATVNVTALPFAPYWEVLEEKTKDGEVARRLSGMDYLMLEAIGSSYNFKINVVPTANWDEVTQRVEERVSFLASVIYAVFPHRMEHYDYSYAFEYAFHAFSMAKPALKPQWQSLYYPLSDLVWLLVLVTLVLAPLPLHLFSRANPEGEEEDLWKGGAFVSVNTVIATLLGQGLSNYLPTRSSFRTLLIFWLAFAFIVGTAYRGNLTASLTLPKYPPRVETLSQLVRSGASVGMPPYGAHFEQFFRESTSDDFKVMAERIDIVPSSKDGLEKALTDNYAYMEARRYLQLLIASKFTRADGSTALYIGRQSVFPGLSAWPFPHDAPYKHAFDRKIMNIIEAGLYEKWNRDMVEAARQRGRLQLLAEKKKKKEATEESADDEEEEVDSDVVPLSLTHMQGPLLLLVLGWGGACLAFCAEILPVVLFRSNQAQHLH